jgi:hypothetical protein
MPKKTVVLDLSDSEVSVVIEALVAEMLQQGKLAIRLAVEQACDDLRTVRLLRNRATS